MHGLAKFKYKLSFSYTTGETSTKRLKNKHEPLRKPFYFILYELCLYKILIYFISSIDIFYIHYWYILFYMNYVYIQYWYIWYPILIYFILYELCLYPILIYFISNIDIFYFIWTMFISNIDIFAYAHGWRVRSYRIVDLLLGPVLAVKWGSHTCLFLVIWSCFVISSVRATNCGPVCGSQMCSFPCNRRYFPYFTELYRKYLSAFMLPSAAGCV